MQSLRSINFYKEMVQRVRSKISILFSNIHFLPADIEKYVLENKALYKEFEKGFILLLEEEKYFKLYIYADIRQEIALDLLNKKIVFRYMYRKGQRQEYLEYIERNLKENNFQKKGTMIYICGQAEKLFENCKKIEPIIRRLEKEGFYYAELPETQYKTAEEMLISEKHIEDYHLEAATQNTIKKYYAIMSAKDELCAVYLGLIDGDVATGAIMAKEEYRMLGLVPMLSYYRYEWLKNNKIKRNEGWIYCDNKESLKYHQRIGFEVKDKYLEDWVLE